MEQTLSIIKPDAVERNLIEEIKSINKNLIISQWNEDPVMPSLKYSEQNISNINEFLSRTDIIISNRFYKELEIVKDKVYTRDIFNRD